MKKLERSELIMAKSNSFMFGACLLIMSFVAGLTGIFIVEPENVINVMFTFGALSNIGLILMCIGAIKSKIVESHNKQIDLLMQMSKADNLCIISTSNM
ncbi:hypothetical protein [Vibrio alginolyticus]|uniref:hypothetical protein n=1 Tax=Vibrio alginolyticus TaxID=663 RepID=UPI001BD600D2|nr:hypothetical protein [Vibrio alginolyticus]MBE4032486.1 hypothetical protein [Vibrio parahaemolyticus]MBS9879938.1 hypothetical protein [Vibrio alginolyticus]UFN72614.1 hypothetical protein LN249_19525 [Vibrio alginolyticus]